jgi:hypothetical protein
MMPLDPATLSAMPPLPPDADAPPAEDDGRLPLIVRLKPRHMEWLRQRAAVHGDTPERHAETILREFQARHDPLRDIGSQAPAGPGQPAATYRPR